MSDKLTPMVPGVGVPDLRRLADDRQRKEGDWSPHRCLGMPTSLNLRNVQAKYGDLILVDPTAGQVVVSLPRSTAEMLGEKVTIKNYSSSTNVIRVQPASPDKIDGAAYKDLTTAWQHGTAVLVMSGKWAWTS